MLTLVLGIFSLHTSQLELGAQYMKSLFPDVDYEVLLTLIIFTKTCFIFGNV